MKAAVRKGGTDRTAPWEVTIPHVGPLVDHVPLTERFDGDPSDPQDMIENAPILGPFGWSTWETFEDALKFYAAAERQVLTGRVGTTVYVAAFRPGDADGGVGGFDWHPDRAVSLARYAQNVREFPECEHALWEHTTDLDLTAQRDAVTAEIDDLEWGWFPAEKAATATVWPATTEK